MIRKSWLAFTVASALALAVACTKSSPSPSSPSAVNPGFAGAAADGSVLKASAPTPVSPINNQQLTDLTVGLVITNATTKFVTSVPLAYRFELYNAAGTRVYQSGLINGGASGTTSHTLPDSVALDGDAPYTWQARAEFEGTAGPWSSRGAFIAANASGYIRGNELYDPLINGKTVGVIHGPVTFIPGRGLSMESLDSYVSYELGQTLVEGEFSILASNVRTNTEGGKTKVMAMSEGYDDITTNNRRFTIEKRADGSMAFRMITHDDQIETGSAERSQVRFNLQDTFFFGTSWRSNVFNMNVRRNGPTGEVLYNITKGWAGRPYDPIPHIVYIGGPSGRAGSDSGTVPNIIIRQVWASSRPRPGFANK